MVSYVRGFNHDLTCALLSTQLAQPTEFEIRELHPPYLFLVDFFCSYLAELLPVSLLTSADWNISSEKFAVIH